VIFSATFVAIALSYSVWVMRWVSTMRARTTSRRMRDDSGLSTGL